MPGDLTKGRDCFGFLFEASDQVVAGLHEEAEIRGKTWQHLGIGDRYEIVTHDDKGVVTAALCGLLEVEQADHVVDVVSEG